MKHGRHNYFHGRDKWEASEQSLWLLREDACLAELNGNREGRGGGTNPAGLQAFWQEDVDGLDPFASALGPEASGVDLMDDLQQDPKRGGGWGGGGPMPP